MDARRDTTLSEKLNAALAGSGVENDLSRWLNEVAAKYGVQSFSFFIDEKSTKDISGRFFFDINPGESMQSKGGVSRSKVSIDNELSRTLALAMHEHPDQIPEVLHAVAEYMSHNPEIKRICEEFQREAYAEKNSDTTYGNNKGAGDALYNFIIAQAAFKVLEAAIQEYLKTIPQDINKNMERIYELKKEIPRVERRLLADPDYKSRSAQKEQKKILAAHQSELEGLVSDKRNTFDTIKMLDSLRKMVNQNVYNHEKTAGLVMKAQARRSAEARYKEVPVVRSVTDPTTKSEKTAAAKRTQSSTAKMMSATGSLAEAKEKRKADKEAEKAAKQAERNLEKMRVESEKRVKEQLARQEKEKSFQENKMFDKSGSLEGEVPDTLRGSSPVKK